MNIPDYAAKNEFFQVLLEGGKLSAVQVQQITHKSSGPVRIRVKIGPPHSHACRKRQLIGVVLRMKPEKLRPRVTVGVAR
jgi:uncharacterized phage-associated protein